MSFSSEFRKEILSKRFVGAGENLAFLSAVAAEAGALMIDEKGRYSIEISSDRYDLIAALNDALFNLYGGSYEVNIKTLENNFKEFNVRIGGSEFKRIATEIGYIDFSDGDLTPSRGIGVRIDSERMLKAYLIGIAAVSATVTVPQRNDSDGVYAGGYHFEISLKDNYTAGELLSLLSEYGIEIKKIERKGQCGLYIKDSAMISDMLAFLGASNAVLELNNIIGIKELMNNVNRAQNCSMANIDKAVNASQRQIAAIKRIEEKIGIASLPEKLRSIALARLENPSSTMEEMLEILDEPLTKSGLNHRLRKLVETAEELGD